MHDCFYPIAALLSNTGEMLDAGLVPKACFDVVTPSKTRLVWETLVSQQALSVATMDQVVSTANLAWQRSDERTAIEPDETDRPCSSLCDKALRCWMAAHLLGEPSLRFVSDSSEFG